MDFMLAAIAAFCYFVGKYSWAFWIVIFAIASGLLAVVRSIADPTWYMSKRMNAGLEPGVGLSGLIIVKIITTGILGAVAWWLARLAGYLS
ncbi:hypothetical protein [Bradyrhizobium tunisiense]|uniref:hypothetical protein n=1 Tax=Bradyrhizobium tunisiense TaxID=3278709 RepID=UPI0035D7A5DB